MFINNEDILLYQVSIVTENTCEYEQFLKG